MTTDPRYPIGKMQFVDYSEKEKEILSKLKELTAQKRKLEAKLS